MYASIPDLWPSCVAQRMARTAGAASVDVYEAAIGRVIDSERLAARSVIYAPLSSLIRAWADLTRDATAVQLSMVRWILDL